jgi:hypothetical protein
MIPLLLASAFAVPALVPFAEILKEYPFQAPTPDDVRGACPGMNTLANHGFINRSGKDISAQQLLDAMEFVYKFSPLNAIRLTITEGLGDSATLDSTGTPVMNLTGAAFHRLSIDPKGMIIEHDVSLTREDATGRGIPEENGVVRHVPISDRFLNDLLDGPRRYPNRAGPPGSFDGWVLYNVRYERMDQSWIEKAKNGTNVAELQPDGTILNPNGWYYNNTLDLDNPTSEAFSSNVESALGLLVFGGRQGESSGYLNNHASYEFFESFLKHERIPDGWEPPSHPLSFDEVNLFAKKIYDLGPQQKFLGY